MTTRRHLKLMRHFPKPKGKSSLLLRFADDDFLNEEETTATIGVDFLAKSIELKGQKYKLSIWVSCVIYRMVKLTSPQDTAGQERFRTLTSSYYRGAQGVILVYDISSRKSFDELIKWFQELETYTGDQVVKIVVGNKVDKVG